MKALFIAVLVLISNEAFASNYCNLFEGSKGISSRDQLGNLAEVKLGNNPTIIELKGDLGIYQLKIIAFQALSAGRRISAVLFLNGDPLLKINGDSNTSDPNSSTSSKVIGTLWTEGSAYVNKVEVRLGCGADYLLP